MYSDKETVTVALVKVIVLGLHYGVSSISTILIKMCKMKGYGMIIIIVILEKVVSLLGFVFVDNTDLVTGTEASLI